MIVFTLPFLPNTVLHRALVPDDTPALFDDKSVAWTTYGEVREKIDAMQVCFAALEKDLIFCVAPRTVDGAVAYMGATASGHAVALVDPSMTHLRGVVAAYRPRWIMAPLDHAYQGYGKVEDFPLTGMALWKRFGEAGGFIHPRLYLILLTSGSTGSSKGVRLSYANVASNTSAVIESLSMEGGVCAVGHLPLSYSFGLSVLNTAMAVGGRVLLTEEGMMSPAFWSRARAQEANLFPGVPYHFEMLLRLSLEGLKIPSLKTFLQAGGKMPVPMTQKVLEAVMARQGGLYIMYGQTEASPRISSFPLHLHPEKIGSSGIPMSGGHVEIVDNEIIYHGPNVMMGYAITREDLCKGDGMHGRLPTGDHGSVDADGYLTVLGREKRIAKLYGQRVALDDLEKFAAALAPVVAIERDQQILLITTAAEESLRDRIKALVMSETGLPPTWLEVRSVADIPHQPNGKVDYQRLRAEA